MEFKILEIMFKERIPMSVFEIGCANGGLLDDLYKHYPGLIVGGMDVSQSLLKSKERFPQCADNFVLWDVNDPWPAKSESYDIVFSVGVLMYIFEPTHVLQEMLRVAKKEVIVAEYHHRNLDAIGIMMKAKSNDGKIYPGIMRNYESLIHKMDPKLMYEVEYTNAKTIIRIKKNV